MRRVLSERCSPAGSGPTRWLGSLLALLLLAGCSSGSQGEVARVDGAAIQASELAELHPADAEVSDDERASSLFLLILHRLLVQSAEEEFGFSVGREDHQEAFAARTNGLGSDVDAALAERGVTQDRVHLEADLDVIREELEDRLVREGAPGFDFDAAYRTFLSSNSRVCLNALQVMDPSAVASLEQAVDAGADVAEVEAAFPQAVEPVEVQCTSPTLLGPGLASVALDGEVGDVHVVETEQGSFVAAVTERDAPPADEVRDAVIQVGAETQGPEVFNRWAADILRDADVEVDDELGRWAPGAQTGDVPTVLSE